MRICSTHLRSIFFIALKQCCVMKKWAGFLWMRWTINSAQWLFFMAKKILKFGNAIPWHRRLYLPYVLNIVPWNIHCRLILESSSVGVEKCCQANYPPLKTTSWSLSSMSVSSNSLNWFRNFALKNRKKESFT